MGEVCIVPVVEGNGDEHAVPLLLRRVLSEWFGRFDAIVARPWNAHGCQNILKPGGLEYFVRAALRLRPAGVLVLLDTDGADPARLACALRGRLSAQDSRGSVVVVCAHPEYEGWLQAGLLPAVGDDEQPAGSLQRCEVSRRFDENVNGKRWVAANVLAGRSYNEVHHQPSLTARMDIPLAATRSRSFQRLLHAIEEILQAHDAGTTIVSPTRCPEP